MTDVVAYTDPSCPHCHRLKSYLNDHGVPFEDRDVTADAEAVEELQRMGAEGVPVLKVGSDTVVGFNPERVNEVLKANGVAVNA